MMSISNPGVPEVVIGVVTSEVDVVGEVIVEVVGDIVVVVGHD